MRKPMGKWGESVVRPLLHANPLFLLLFAAFFLALPETATAQIWVSSGFKPAPAGPNGQQNETAYCSTSAVNPATGLPSPAAADYLGFVAYCSMSTSTGQTIYSPQCPLGTGNQGNPTAICTIVFQPQPGVTYSIPATNYPSADNNGITNWLVFNVDPPSTACGQWYGTPCFSDPLGYFSYEWIVVPTYSSTSSTNTVEIPCSARGNCTPQNIPHEVCLHSFFGYCTYGVIETLQQYGLARVSATWTPACADVVTGSVSVNGASSFPYTVGSPTISATFTPNFGFTIAQAAQTCGFTNFNWQQWITNMPLPSPFFAVGSTVPLQAPPAYLDPPPGGYTYELLQKDSNGNPKYPTGDNAYPFYWNPTLNPEQTGDTELIDNEFEGTDGTELSFSDTPQDSCLYGGSAVGTPYCSGSGAGIFDSIQFTTCLVGVNSDGTPYNLGICFNWYSTFNGTSGGASTTKNTLPMDPGSGTGNITITHTNESTNYQYPKSPGLPVSTLTFLDRNQISTTASGLAYSRVTKTFNGTMTITNDSENTITGPFQIVLDSMPTGVTLVNATGNFGGWPYITVPNVVSLEPGQSASVGVQFSNPKGIIINSIPMVYSGSFE